jgi:hypothetical protein
MSAPAPTHTEDRFAVARSVADAVLYEGYVLYPYRASARKNQVRWQFGVLVPGAVSASDPSERAATRTECIVDLGPRVGAAPQLSVRIRFLQVQRRVIEAATGDPTVFLPVSRLDVDGQVHVDWEEAVERVVDVGPRPLLPLGPGANHHDFEFPSGLEYEDICDVDGTVHGRAVRSRDSIGGRVRIDTEWVAGSESLVKVVVVVENTSGWVRPGATRDEIVRHSLVAVHTMLALDGALFVSIIDPPPDAAASAAACINDGTFPVLIGSDDVVLSSPIILYDHPEVAPESPGDLYDSTEIDEILALRVLTLTDEEKAEARGTDPRSAAIIDRCDDMPPEMWERLHGIVRAIQDVPTYSEVATAAEPPSDQPPGGGQVPWWDPGSDSEVDPATDSVMVRGVTVKRGSRVVLHPNRRADAHDFFFAGLNATVAGVFKDVDGNVHVAVSVDDDPATEELAWQGRYLYFFPDEVEPATSAEATR